LELNFLKIKEFGGGRARQSGRVNQIRYGWSSLLLAISSWHASG